MTDYLPTGTFWFTLALINAGLAEQKGRSRWNWFALSIFLGPIATALIVVWEPPDSTLETYGDSFSRYWRERKAKRALKKASAASAAAAR